MRDITSTKLWHIHIMCRIKRTKARHQRKSATSLEVQDMENKSLFPDFTVVETGIKHGTVTVVINGENVEITTYRTEGEYTDSRHPDKVEFTTSLELDLSLLL